MSFHDKQPQLIKNEPSKLREHIRKGISAFLVIVAGVLFFFAMYRFNSIMRVLGGILEVLSPIIYGFVFAFLLNPIVRRVERFLQPKLRKIVKKEETSMKVSRVLGIIAAFLFAGALITALLNMIIPEVYNNVKQLVITLPDDIRSFGDKINTLLQGNTTVHKLARTVFGEVNEAVENWVTTDLLNWVQSDLLAQTGNIVSGITAGVINVVNVVFNLLVGLMVSVYLLYGKETFIKQGRKIIYAVCKPKRANLILHIARKANEIFSGFIIGKVIDSTIIGILCFIGLSILRMPYALLVSVIVGVTNVIPFFGPFIGAIPSAILIFLVDPMKGLGFVVFVLVLQQLDGNVIGPKILGDTTGLPSFWVIFSILVSGGLFGFPGMILGVPTFALIYYIVKMAIQQKLEQKNLPIETDNYTEKSYVDENGVFYTQPEENEKEEVKEDADSCSE